MDSSRYTRKHADKARNILTRLSQDEQLRLAACCLSDRVYADELDCVLGAGCGKSACAWLEEINVPLTKKQDNAIVIDDDFRWLAIAAVIDLPEFKSIRNRWAPYGRLTKNVPNRQDRSQLYPLAGLQWMDAQLCRHLFGEKGNDVFAFIEDHPNYFIRNRSRYSISQRFQADLRKAAENREHRAAAANRKAAASIWNETCEELKIKLENLQRTLKITNEELNQMERRQTEATAYLRVLGKKGRDQLSSISRARRKAAGRGPAIGILALIGVCAALAALALEGTPRLASLASAMIALAIAGSLVPGWMKARGITVLPGAGPEAGSPESIIQETASLAHQIQGREIAIEELQQQVVETKSLLKFPYV